MSGNYNECAPAWLKQRTINTLVIVVSFLVMGFIVLVGPFVLAGMLTVLFLLLFG